MAIEEAVIHYCADPDFGALRLIETQTEARVNGGPWKRLVHREWVGATQDLAVTISISNTDNPPNVRDQIRAAFLAIIHDIDGFRRTAAGRLLAAAQDWAAQGGLANPLDVDLLTRALAITNFRVGSDRLTIFLEDRANIFDGHAIEVRIENGSIIEINLAG